MAANWSDIPEELVGMVAERLVCVDDLIRFGAVCKPWRSASILEKQNKNKAFAPLLMLAMVDNDDLPKDDDDGEGVRSFVIPYDGPNKMRRSFDIQLPKAQGRRCWGSPYGWVVTIGLDFNISLLNPLTGAHLPLPPQPILQDQSLCTKNLPNYLTPDKIISIYINKFTLGWHQSSQRWLVMAIFGDDEEVAFTFTGIGNEAAPPCSWTCIESTVDTQDVILFQDRIFMITCGGELKVCDIEEGIPPKAIQIAPRPEYLNVRYTFYLVEMGRKLHFVCRFFDSVGAKEEYHCVTSYFGVLRFNFRKKKWCELDDLGEYALFLGNNTSFALSTTTYPDFKRNCVYFTDDHNLQHRHRFCDMGVSSYEEDRTVETFHNPNMGAFSKFSRPLFFMPTL